MPLMRVALELRLVGHHHRDDGFQFLGERREDRDVFRAGSSVPVSPTMVGEGAAGGARIGVSC